FSKQAKVQVLTSGEPTANATTAGISGTATVRTALTRLLKSSGLGFKVMADDAIAVGSQRSLQSRADAGTNDGGVAGTRLSRVDVPATADAGGVRPNAKDGQASADSNSAVEQMTVEDTRLKPFSDGNVDIRRTI